MTERFYYLFQRNLGAEPRHTFAEIALIFSANNFINLRRFFMNIAGVFRLCLVATLALPTAAKAGQCDPSKPVYVFDQFDQGDDTKIFYKTRTGEHPFYMQLVRFETWRKSKLVWSIDGSVICSDVIPMCDLTLASSNKSDPDAAIDDCLKKQEQDTPTPKVPFKIPVTEIFTKQETSHICVRLFDCSRVGVQQAYGYPHRAEGIACRRRTQRFVRTTAFRQAGSVFGITGVPCRQHGAAAVMRWQKPIITLSFQHRPQLVVNWSCEISHPILH
jgi:hypothetical protein